MEKRAALKILIDRLPGIGDDLRKRLINAVPVLSDSEVAELGKDLAEIIIAIRKHAKISAENITVIKGYLQTEYSAQA
jgi:hypothetical protein